MAKYRVIPQNTWTIQVKTHETFRDLATIKNINDIDNLKLSPDEKVELKTQFAQRQEVFNSLFAVDYLTR
jgi:hypothetical protein